LGRGGAEKLAIEITQELNKRNDVEALLVSFDKTENYVYNTEGLNYKFCPSKVDLSMKKKNRSDLDDYLKILNEFKPHIIHSHRYLSELITRYNISKEISYITHCHDNIKQFKKASLCSFFNKEKMTNLYERRFIFRKYKECDNNFIAISKDTVNYLNNNLPAGLQKNIYLIHNAIDFHRYSFALRKTKLEGNKRINLINVGNFSRKKNQIFLLEVIAILLKQGIHIHMVLLGEGEERAKIEHRIVELGLGEHISLKGNVENVEDFYRESDLYIHSATYEPFGLVLLEAMASGLPVISLDGKGNRDIMKDGWNGYIIEKEDPEIFAEKITRLISDTELYQRVSENAVNYAKEYDIENYIEKLTDLYKEILCRDSIKKK
jgi:glycosyltransferase involved in cell wall biosynthesis